MLVAVLMLLCVTVYYFLTSCHLHQSASGSWGSLKMISYIFRLIGNNWFSILSYKGNWNPDLQIHHDPNYCSVKLSKKRIPHKNMDFNLFFIYRNIMIVFYLHYNNRVAFALIPFHAGMNEMVTYTTMKNVGFYMKLGRYVNHKMQNCSVNHTPTCASDEHSCQARNLYLKI